MGWTEKEKPTAFDQQPMMTGLFYLDGDIIARRIGRDWTAGQKYPTVVFPSDQQFDLWESSSPEAGGIIHVYGEMDLPYRDTRDRAYEQAGNIAEQLGYMVRKVGEDGLEVWGHDEDEHYLITYDHAAGQMADIVPVIESDAEPPVHPAHQLMTNEIQERLPDLTEAREQGEAAIAQVKYFTPDAQWSWYASGFDGEDILYGLVIGYEMEMGPFWLSELKEIRGPFKLPIERDLHFEPQTLEKLREYHRRLRGE